MLDEITPLVLTYNEAPNIGRVLDRLRWAKRAVVLDSYSDDETEAIARGYPNVSFYKRKFDNHASQWNFGLRKTGIDTIWVLAIDSDYILPYPFVEELGSLLPGSDVAGYRARFRYCIEGVPLRGAAYTPVTVLFRRDSADYEQQGHTQRVRLDGVVASLRTPIHHDDRKPLDRWFASQLKYMELEAEKVVGTPWERLDFADRIRKAVVVAPLAMFAYCMIVKLALFDGRRGLLYACQRATAEIILSLFMLQKMLR